MDQRLKNLMILLVSAWLLLVSCGTKDRILVEEQIRKFELEHLPDKRETVFSTEAHFERGNVVLLGETDNAQLKEKLLSDLQQWKVEDRIRLLPDSTVGDKTFALVNLSVANLRAEPSHTSELVSQALLGTPVKVLKEQNGWFLIQTPDRYISWVDAAGIYRFDRNGLNAWKQSDRIILKGKSDVVYNNEYLQQPMADVSMGGILEVMEQRRYVTKVAYPDGREGYVRPGGWESFTEFKETALPDTTSVVDLARSMMGRPYMWGGTSVTAMDCSGFSKLIYYMHGVVLARDASLQARYGRQAEQTVTNMNFMPGDLLFFGTVDRDDNTGNITHVAMSLGKGEYIHAAGRVDINSFDPEDKNFSAYRRNTFIKAIRIIGLEGTEGIVRLKDHEWY